tara:strand:- start:1722 stop:1871 length:150 start_codon:yes stop_codon:yes gene_type:complete
VAKEEKKKKAGKSAARPNKLKAIRKLAGRRAASNKNRAAQRSRTKGGSR